jgi:hypothetical protein
MVHAIEVRGSAWESRSRARQVAEETTIDAPSKRIHGAATHREEEDHLPGPVCEGAPLLSATPPV